jgi:penicillin-binding protein 1C
LNKKIIKILIAAGVLIAPVLFSPLPRFNSPLATVVEASNGNLLGARIADDGQWRFPPSDKVSEKFEKSLLTYEDKYFRFHPGINPVSIIRAFLSNIKAGEIVSGGSTITMQVSRLARGNSQRTYFAKVTEMLSALKLELFRSKKEILLTYSANAPFGGNIVGIGAASWRYTGKSSFELSWAEAATLAVLPNSPSLIFPGKNQDILKSKRDKLLKKLFERDYIDSLTYILALDEPLPVEPKALPAKAPHLTDYFFLNNKGQNIKTTINQELQESATEILNNHQKKLEENNIYNSACIIIEVKTGNVLVYVGNSTLPEIKSHGGDVDIIRSMRSTGSILKPFLFAGIQQSGDILPNSLIADIPTRFPGFTPENFDLTYSGAVPAGYALSQSLNIPAVRMLQQYNTERFLNLLKRSGFTTFTKPADHYGLSLILGGGEITLWELTGAYASLSRVLNNYNHDKKYYREDYHEPLLTGENKTDAIKHEDSEPPYSASAIWLTYEALQKVNRPESEMGWQYFSSSTHLAWKTGTSFGFRDGWAVGTTPGYVIGVWAGNADGEGRPGLTGITAAAPVLFELSALLDSEKWFESPDEELTGITVCSQSGYRAGPDCPETAETEACTAGLKSESCPYHHLIHLNKSKTFQVSSECESTDEIVSESWFVLTPAMEYFYKQKHPGYRVLPPFSPGCNQDKTIPVMEFIYPSSGVKIFIPRDQEGNLTRIIPEIAHRNPSERIFWHLDDSYISTTRYLHHIEILAGPGNHTLTAVDEDGNTIRCGFTIVGKK